MILPALDLSSIPKQIAIYLWKVSAKIRILAWLSLLELLEYLA